MRDSTQTTALRSLVRARRDLVHHRVALANQLRAHLQTVFPAATTIFEKIDSQISLTFLERFTTQPQADWLSAKRLGSWLRSVSYSGHTDPVVLHAKLIAAPRGLSGEHADAHAATTLAYVAALRVLSAQIQTLAARIGDQLAVHPDGHIFTSLPRSGTVRAARLLAEIGDARGRFPTPVSLACLAGVAPSTRESGKVRIVAFRWAVDKQLRDAVADFAGDSRHANPWVANLYNKAIAGGHNHPHAVRILARAWLHIIWRAWQDGLDYDPARHGALQTLLNQDQQLVALHPG